MPETLTLDPTSEDSTNTPLELNDGSIVIVEHAYPAPPLEVSYQGSIDTEGQLPAASKYGNRTITLTVECWTQAALDALQAKVAKIGAEGGTLKRVLATGEQIVFDLVAHDTFDPRFDTVYHNGGVTVVALSFPARPHGRGEPLATVVDDFASNTAADYTSEAGGGTFTITGGAIVPTSTAVKRLLHSGSPYDFYDSQVTIKITTGTAVPVDMGIVLKHTGVTNFYIGAFVRNTANQLRIVKREGGVETLLASAAGTVNAATTYWVRGRTEGNSITFELWTAAPTVAGTPAATVTHTLAGGDQTTFGAGVPGRAGIRWTPADLNERIDDLTIEPNIFRSSLPLLTADVRGVPGNVDAETTVVLTDAEGADRRLGQWGAGPAGTANLLIDSDSLVTTGFGGTGATLAGAYNPDGTGNSVIRSNVFAEVTAVCGTGTLTHTGSFRVFARVYATETDCQVRLAWRDKDSPFSPNDWATVPQEDQWTEVDLGLVTLRGTNLGTQDWTGRIEAYNLNGGSIDIDLLTLFPVDYGYGIATSVPAAGAGVIVGYASFVSTTAGSNLNGAAGSIGGNWATSGDATDFQFSDDSVGLTGETIKRSAVSGSAGRLAVLGAADLVDTQVEVAFRTPGGVPREEGVIARWVDASNYLRATYGTGGYYLTVTQRVAGVETVLASAPAPSRLGYVSAAAIRLIVRSSGSFVAQLLNGSKTSVLGSVTGSAAALATGGTLEDGKPGIFDRNTTATAGDRYYDSFTVYTPPAEDIVIRSGRDLRVASHGRVERSSSDGARYGKANWEGHRIVLPPGDARVAARANRLDLTSSAYDTLDDVLQVQIAPIVPRYLVVPEASS